MDYQLSEEFLKTMIMWRSVSKMLRDGVNRNTVILKIPGHPYNHSQRLEGSPLASMHRLPPGWSILTLLVPPGFPNFPSVSRVLLPSAEGRINVIFLKELKSHLDREMFCFGIKLAIGQWKPGGWEPWVFLELMKVETSLRFHFE